VLLAQLALFALGLMVLASMAIGAHMLAYFPGDVAISQAVQAYSSDTLDQALGAVSWLGFPPQGRVLFGLVAVLLFVFGARWAAAMAAMAAIGSGGLYLLLEHVVGQPRPSPELVRVVSPIENTGFPSGHLATVVAVYGFLALLGYRRFAPSNVRFLPVALVFVFAAVMAFARIYAGHHWPSDVVAGALLGLLWLAVVVRAYHWGESRLVHGWPRVPRPAVGTNSAYRPPT
jgi:undecaprenyl-diphosphatase